MEKPTTLDQLMQLLGQVLPGATVDEDLEGQLVIYTDRRVGDEGELVRFESL